ncbi:MAG: hypothetical protein ACI8S6_001579 [Myxococcota bacterium]
MTRQTPAERRLGAAMLIIALASVVAASILILTGADAVLGGPGRLAVAACALMVGIEPRRHRPYSLPIILASVTACVLAAGDSAWGAAVWDGVVGFGGIWLSESARRSVSGAVLRGGPPIG